MDYSGNATQLNKKRIIIVTAAMAAIVLILLIIVIVAAVNKKANPSLSEANNTTFSSEVAENLNDKKDNTHKEGAEAEKAEPVENTTENSQKDTKKSEKGNETTLPTTGPEELLPLGLVLGAATAFVSSKRLAKAERA